MTIITGQLVDLHHRSIYPAEIILVGSSIKSIQKIASAPSHYILPGFVDAHVHIESSMLIPSEFARLALAHGTVATVSDPHEIANVLGIEGIEFMIENGNQVPLKFYFGAPSCVPPTIYETSGAVINSQDIKALMNRPEIKYLAEMMNYPGVLFSDKEVMAKIQYAKEAGKPIDGHAPGLVGDQAIQYINEGISTDHECYTYKEGKHKIDHGMKVLIREGSAAKNYEALAPLFHHKPDQLMFCSDDKHPDDLVLGHINLLVRRAIADGYNLFDVLRAACVHPVNHYSLDVGLLREGDLADFIIVEDLKNFVIKEVYIEGAWIQKVDSIDTEAINQFNTSRKTMDQFEVKWQDQQANIICALNGEIITKHIKAYLPERNGLAVSDVESDYLKIAVINRYANTHPAVGFIHGFGLKQGAIASCVGHDTHNIIVVACDDQSLIDAVNLIIENKGGISAVSSKDSSVLPLPYAGIMSGAPAEQVAAQYALLDRFAKEDLSCSLSAPYMTLSFMALLVIPSLKLSDLGLFDGSKFEMLGLWE